MSIKIARNTTIGGKSFADNRTIVEGAQLMREATVAAAKPGVLTTRTDNDTGTFTMDPGHGFITGDKIDVFWNVGGVIGHRRGMTATVTGDSAVLDAGAGDVLPAAASAITAMKPTPLDLRFDGAEALVLAAYSDAQGVVSLRDGSAVELYAFVLPLGPQGKSWYSTSGETAPTTGVVAFVYFSHASTSAKKMRVGVGVS